MKSLVKGDAALIITGTILLAILGKRGFVPRLISIDAAILALLLPLDFLFLESFVSPGLGGLQPPGLECPA